MYTRSVDDPAKHSGPVQAMINHANKSEPGDVHAVTINDTGRDEMEAEVESGLRLARSRRWSGELTLHYPWRSYALATLGEEWVSHWTESDEADFRDGIYHSGFKWRVATMTSIALSVCLMMLLDPCLTMLGALTCPFQILLMCSQIACQRMLDRRRARQLGQWTLILICSGFGVAAIPLSLFASSGKLPTWDGSLCSEDKIATYHPLLILNLLVGPGSVFVGVMVTFMTISIRGFVVMLAGFLGPCCASYLLIGLRMETMETVAVSPVPSSVMAAITMTGCFAGGATIGCMYVVLQRRAAIKTAYELKMAQRKNEQSTERVEQVEKARGFDRELMMAMTFHEVRNPLNGTVGHLRLAKQLVASMRKGDTVGGSRVREANGGHGGGRGVEGSEGGGDALVALEEEVDQSIFATELAVQYLGTLATLHGALTGSRELVLAPTELAGLVSSAAAVVRPQLQPGVELRIEVPQGKMHVLTDELMLMQVLLNLMQNAARFTKQGFVCVRCSVEQSSDGGVSANFAVLDSGSGMSDATKATLFDLYNSVGGIGLGMFLSGKLLSLLGSSIEVESPWRSDGPGAAFYFSIDVAVAPAAAGVEKEPDLVSNSVVQEVQNQWRVEDPAQVLPQPGQAADVPPYFESSLRVLVADDGQTNRRLLRRVFTGFFGQGWSVTEATTAEEALALAIDTEFALIVMDEIFAPGLEAMRGSAAILDLRAHEAQAGAARRAVIVSCTGNAPSLVDLKNSGADLVWGKPMPNFTNNEMQNELAPHLAASLARAQSYATPFRAA